MRKAHLKILVACALALAACTSSTAQMTTTFAGKQGGGGGGGCSNALDFSQACNSQYLAIGIF